MNEIILFIITAGFIVGITLVESRHDFWVIMYQNTVTRIDYPQDKDKWKFWGNFYELAWISFYVVTVMFFLDSRTVLFWIPIFWIIRTIFHNGFIAVMLGEKFMYLGNIGFDQKIKKMFLGSGAVFLAVEIFILAILILSYISVKFNLDLWQLILNIFRK